MPTTYEKALKESIAYFNGDNMAAEVFLGKYALTMPDGAILESTPRAMHKRLAKELARIEQKYPNPMSEAKIFGLLDKFSSVILAGSPMAGIGTESPYDAYGGSLKTDQELAQQMKRRAGVGFDISNIRPRAEHTAKAAKTTDGIGVFMQRFSNTCKEVAQGGRRGALMQSISVHHPEIETFIEIKRDRSKVTNANISIRVTDEFMTAVKAGEQVQLRWPVNSKDPEIERYVDAKELWDKIIDSAHECAEPGILFWDTCTTYTPSDAYASKGFSSISVNPCITKDSWILTTEGPRQVSSLIDTPFNAIVNGTVHPSSAKGFFKTGNKKVYQIKTKRGFSIKATSNHEFLIDGPNGQKWRELGTLKPGENLVLQNQMEASWAGKYSFKEGWLVGNLLGDGNITKKNGANLDYWGPERLTMMSQAESFIKETLGARSDMTGHDIPELNKARIGSRKLGSFANKFGLQNGSKVLNEKIEETSRDFHRGFLSGWFDADGTVTGTKEKGYSARLCSTNLSGLKTAQRMLSRLGIVSSVYENRRQAGVRKMPDGHGGLKEYLCKATHDLVVAKNNLRLFQEVVGFTEASKRNKLTEIVSEKRARGFYKEKFSSEIVSITELPDEEEVYDCTIPSAGFFDANGISTHNCAEIILSKNDSCRLTVVNAYSFVENAFKEDAWFDFKKFVKVAGEAQRIMDDIIDLELECIDRIVTKIKNDPEPAAVKAMELGLWQNIKSTCEKGRRTGLGVTGVGDTVAALGITYGSPGSIDLVGEIYKHLALGSYRSSVKMAQERGTFPIYNHKLEKDHPMIQRMMALDSKMAADYELYGRRNIANTTTAPCGSLSIEAQVSSGVEPVYHLKYDRRRKINSGDKAAKVDYVDDEGVEWQEYEVKHHAFARWQEVTGKKNPKDSPFHKATATEIDWVASVDLQAAAQHWIDHAISKTCNLPEDVSKEVVSDVYMRAWEKKCKGFTVYREGSRQGVLITKKFNINNAVPRPDELACDIYHMTVRGEKWNIFVGLYDEKPYEIFAGRAEYISIPRSKTKGVIKKNGKYNVHMGDGDNEIVIKDLARVFENKTESAFTRTLSLAMRHGAPVQYVVEQLEKGADKESEMFSLSKGLMRCLKNYIKDGSKPSMKECSQCGSADLGYQEGCVSCNSCGWSKCS
jgi:ribonucleoside-diphosphate reductase alpha chain